MVGERVGVVDAGVLPGYTFVGMDIKTPKAGNEFVGRTLDNGRSVIFYATGTITDSSPQTWYGDLYAPWGLVSYTGGAKPFDGYLQAWKLSWTGGGADYTGTGAIEGGSGPTPGNIINVVVDDHVSMDE